MGHESLKEIWKNIHFENLRADFLKKRCQNSIRQTSRKILTICMVSIQERFMMARVRYVIQLF